MQITSIFKIILKSIGILLLLNCFYVITQFFSTLQVSTVYETEYILLLLVWSIAGLAVYILGIYIFLFKDDYIIEKLKLDKGFANNTIDVNINYENALRTGIIIVAAFVFLESAPDVIIELFSFIKVKSANLKYDNYGRFIYHILRVLAAILIVTNNKAISSYLIKKQA